MTTREVLLHAESADAVWGVRDCSVAERRHTQLNITFRKAEVLSLSLSFFPLSLTVKREVGGTLARPSPPLHRPSHLSQPMAERPGSLPLRCGSKADRRCSLKPNRVHSLLLVPIKQSHSTCQMNIRVNMSPLTRARPCVKLTVLFQIDLAKSS